MAIFFSYEVDGDLLRAKASGFDENLGEVQNYGMAIIHACIENGCTRVLCDETELEYRLGMVDTIKLAEHYAEYGVAAKRGKVALVCSPDNMPDAEFFEDAAYNRGLWFKVFGDAASAEAWLRS